MTLLSDYEITNAARAEVGLSPATRDADGVFFLHETDPVRDRWCWRAVQLGRLGAYGPQARTVCWTCFDLNGKDTESRSECCTVAQALQYDNHKDM